MHQTLYRKWRPATFDEVSGQDHVTTILKNEIADSKTAHAYLFCGSRGTGKTSCAKIFAKAVNCLSPVNGDPCGKCEACLAVAAEATTDIVEMDAASNTGVDYIRDIRDSVVFSPAMLKYRVFIIDEVHMLSQQAFNALLKTLEEPPESVIFILATTEPNKLPVTVVSRCQRFDFTRLSVNDISARLAYIAAEEKIDLDESAARLIAKLARGGMRDAISLLELCAASNVKVDVDRVNEAAGVPSRESVERVFTALWQEDRAAIFEVIAGVYASSLDITEFWIRLIEYCRDLMVVSVSSDAAAYLELTGDEIASLSGVAGHFTFEKLAYFARMLDSTLTDLQKGTYDNRVLAEMTLIKMTSVRLCAEPEALAARISELEEKLSRMSAGAPAPEPAPVAPEPQKKPEPAPAVAGEKTVKVTATASVEPPRRLSNWADIVERIGARDMMLTGFFNGSSAVRDEQKKKLIVRIGDEFALGMLDSPETRGLIIDSAVSVDPANAGFSVEFEVTEASDGDEDPVEELLK